MRPYWWVRRNLTPYQLKRKTIWALQRARQGWATPDVWSFDHYLAGVIAGGLKQLRDNHIGYPAEFRTDKNTDKDADQKWNDTLDAIIEGFELYVKDEWWYDNPNQEADQAKINKAQKLFIKFYGHFWD